jgi:hypothetical protein
MALGVKHVDEWLVNSFASIGPDTKLPDEPFTMATLFFTHSSGTVQPHRSFTVCAYLGCEPFAEWDMLTWGATVWMKNLNDLLGTLPIGHLWVSASLTRSEKDTELSEVDENDRSNNNYFASSHASHQYAPRSTRRQTFCKIKGMCHLDIQRLPSRLFP